MSHTAFTTRLSNSCRSEASDEKGEAEEEPTEPHEFRLAEIGPGNAPPTDNVVSAPVLRLFVSVLHLVLDSNRTKTFSGAPRGF